MEEKNRIAKVGPHEVDISKVVRDPRGIEDIVTEILEKDFVESRYAQFGAHLSILPDAADLADWDHTLLDRYEPVYTGSESDCNDCPAGPCALKEGPGRCSLGLDSYRARLSLRKACRGCMTQITASRSLLDYCLKVWKEDEPVSMGELLTMSDACPPIGTLSGIYVKTLKDVNRVLSYGEAQLANLFQASFTALGTVKDFESMTMHAGSVLMLAMGVAEVLKVSCFGFASAANHRIDELENYPPPTIGVGWGSVEPGKPVLAFAGDNFLPSWTAIQGLNEQDLTEQVEVCGVGPAGDDIARFYDRCRIIAPATRAARAIRNGVFDVIVATTGCMPADLLVEAKKVKSRLIWVSHQGTGDLVDMTDEPEDKIVDALVKGAAGAWIRDPEKAGRVALAVVRKVKRDYVPITEAAAIDMAGSCQAGCDLCTMACPNNLPLSNAIRQLQGGNWDGMAALERGCYFCGKCEEACPSKTPIRDIIVAAERKAAATDKGVMRAGRGPLPLTEVLQSAFSMVWGNAPGIVILVGCGDAHRDEIGWIANELTRRNCIVFVAGCGAAEIARVYNPNKEKHIYQLYSATIEPRSLINCGGCSAISLANNMYMYSRAAGGIPLYGGIPEVGEGSLYTTFSLLVWGAIPDRMQAIAAAYARLGIRTVMGPTSGWSWGRYMPGNRYDRSKWWVYHGDNGQKRETEPVPEHMIIPVETKEEALTMIPRSFFSTSEMREGRAARLDFFLELYRLFYNELPEDWHLLVRSHLDIPTRHRIKLIKLLEQQHGWKGEGIKLNKVRNRDGKLMTLSEFNTSYGMELGRYHCRLKRLLPNSVKDGKSED